MKAKSRNAKRRAKHRALRRKIKGTASQPRLGVFKSCRYTYAYIADDSQGKMLMSLSTRKLDASALEGKGTSAVAAATALGKALGAAAVKAGVENVVFDRSGYTYHGRIKAVAEGARAAGLKF